MLKSWCEATSCNGILDLYNSRESKGRFTFWTLVLATMFSCGIYLTYATISFYMASPTVTNMVMVHQKPLDMPDVLICYRGGLNFSAMQAENFSVDLMRSLSVSSGATSEFPLEDNVKQEMNDYIHQHNLTTKEMYNKFYTSCEEMIGQFKVPDAGDNIFTNQTLCNKATLVPSLRGGCYVFNNNSQQIYPYETGMMVLTLKDVKNVRNKIFSRKESMILGLQNSFTISLEKHFGRQVSNRYFIIPLNSVVLISLNTKLYTRLSRFNHCMDQPNYYTTSSCVFACYNKEVIDKCHCMDIEVSDFEIYPNVDLCDPFDLKQCNYSMETVHECEARCLPKCEEWVFESTVTSSLIDSDDNSANRMSIVYIGYNTMEYAKIKEVEAFTFDMAIGSVGGQFGIFLGASFITVIQAIYYTFLAVSKPTVPKSTTATQLLMSDSFQKTS